MAGHTGGTPRGAPGWAAGRPPGRTPALAASSTMDAISQGARRQDLNCCSTFVSANADGAGWALVYLANAILGLLPNIGGAADLGMQCGCSDTPWRQECAG